MPAKHAPRARIGRAALAYLPQVVPSEAELSGLTVPPEQADLLEQSPYRAGVMVRLGVGLLPSVLTAIEAQLEGREPQVWVQERSLIAHFAVGDKSELAWDRVAAFGADLASFYGDGINSLTGGTIREIDTC